MAYGVYAADGTYRTTTVTGSSLTGLYAADGSYNIVLDDTTYKGLYHPCGAYRVNSGIGTTLFDASGAMYSNYFLGSPLGGTGIFAPVIPGTLTAGRGTYTVSGVDMMPARDTIFSADVGTYPLTGQDASFFLNRVIASTVGTYTLTGIDAALVDQPVGQNTMTAGAASYVLTGVAATLTDTPPSGSVIASIQKRSIALGVGVSSNTDTTGTGMTSVNAAKSSIILNGVTNDIAGSAQYARAGVRLTLTSGTTVTAVRENSTTNAATIYYTIVEFASGVNSIQYDNIAITSGNTSNTKAKTAVGATGFILWLGASISTSAINYSDIQSGLSLNTATGVVTANIGGSLANTITTDFVIVDLDSTIVSAVQQVALTSAAGTTTDSGTLSPAVTMANTMLAYGGASVPLVGVTSAAAYAGALTSTTNVTWTRTGSGSVSRTHYYTAVSFNASALSANGVQRPGGGKIAITATTSNTATLAASVNTAKAFVNWCGITAASANANTVNPNLILTSGTIVTATVPASGTTTAGFEVIEFA